MPSTEEDVIKLLSSSDEDRGVNTAIVSHLTKLAVRFKDSTNAVSEGDTNCRTKDNTNLDKDQDDKPRTDSGKLAKQNAVINTVRQFPPVSHPQQKQTPILQYSPSKLRFIAVASVADDIWRPIKAFEDVVDINVITTSIQAIWAKLLPSESYKPNTPIPPLVEFIKCFVQKKEPQTNTSHIPHPTNCIITPLLISTITYSNCKSRTQI